MITIREWDQKAADYVARETITAVEARALIGAERRKNGHRPQARVNRALSKDGALDVLEKAIAHLQAGAPVPTAIARNVARECGVKALAARIGRRVDAAAGQ